MKKLKIFHVIAFVGLVALLGVIPFITTFHATDEDKNSNGGMPRITETSILIESIDSIDPKDIDLKETECTPVPVLPICPYQRSQERAQARQMAQVSSLFNSPVPSTVISSRLANQIQANNYTFTARDGRTISVEYTFPQNITTDTRIVFVFHGMGRGRVTQQLRVLSSHANVIAIAPQFTAEQFPSSDYQFIGVGNNLHNPENWTSAIIDDIYLDFLERFNLPMGKYIMLGHSAGGQFVHRSVIFSQSEFLDFGIAANAGSYTLPDMDLNYNQRGIGNLYHLHGNLINSNFGRRLYILVGSQDNDPDCCCLARNDTLDLQQGDNRFDRAFTFYLVSRDHTQQHNLPFNWELVIMDGFAHSLDIRLVIDILLGLYQPQNPRID